MVQSHATVPFRARSDTRLQRRSWGAATFQVNGAMTGYHQMTPRRSTVMSIVAIAAALTLGIVAVPSPAAPAAAATITTEEWAFDFGPKDYRPAVSSQGEIAVAPAQYGGGDPQPEHHQVVGITRDGEEAWSIPRRLDSLTEDAIWGPEGLIYWLDLPYDESQGATLTASRDGAMVWSQPVGRYVPFETTIVLGADGRIHFFESQGVGVPWLHRSFDRLTGEPHAPQELHESIDQIDLSYAYTDGIVFKGWTGPSTRAIFWMSYDGELQHTVTADEISFCISDPSVAPNGTVFVGWRHGCSVGTANAGIAKLTPAGEVSWKHEYPASADQGKNIGDPHTAAMPDGGVTWSVNAQVDGLGLTRFDGEGNELWTVDGLMLPTGWEDANKNLLALQVDNAGNIAFVVNDAVSSTDPFRSYGYFAVVDGANGDVRLQGHPSFDDNRFKNFGYATIDDDRLYVSGHYQFGDRHDLWAFPAPFTSRPWQLEAIEQAAASVGDGGGEPPAPPQPPSPTETPTPADDSRCADIHFVSVRGSGQSAANVNDFTNTPETRQVLDGLKSVVDNRDLTVDSHQLNYRARSVDILEEAFKSADGPIRKQQRFRRDLRIFLSSPRAGVQILQRHLNRHMEDCANGGKTPHLVLAGYSQGAMVIHEYLRQLNDDGERAISSAILGVALVADPQRVANSEAVPIGGADISGAGLCPFFETLSSKFKFRCFGSEKTSDVPSSFHGRTWSLCYEGDVVCDWTSLVDINTGDGYATAWDYGKAVHGMYASRAQETLSIGRAFGRQASD